MTLAQFIIAYAVCWWLVLFMLLPHKANPPQKPGPGHAPSAPETPHLKAKLTRATLWAFVPAALIYFIADAAGASEGIYTTRGRCQKFVPYQMPKDVLAEDATMNKSTMLGDGPVEIPLEIPSTRYLNPDTHSGDLSESHLSLGKLAINADGTSLLNGQSISGQEGSATDCGDEHE